jgi:hypothetical protein
MPDSTIGEIEGVLANFPKAVAGAESRIAEGLKQVLGVGEEIANITGLNHIAGIFEKISTGEDSVLQKVDAGEQVVSHVGVVAQSVTPPQLAQVIVPESGKVLAAAKQAVNFVEAHSLPDEVKILVKHNFNLIQSAHAAVQALELGSDVVANLPFLHFTGTIAATVAGVNAFLHWLEPKLAGAISPADTANPSALPPTHGGH